MRSPFTRKQLTDAENAVLRTSCTLAILALIVPATYVYLLLPMATDLGADPSQTRLLRAIPNIGSLLAIFPAAALNRRLGSRTMLIGTGMLVAAGGAAVALAPVVPVVTAGMVLLSVGRSVLMILVVAMLAEATTPDGSRPIAFSTYGMVDSGVFVLAPLVGGLLVTAVSWRALGALWALSGVGLVAVARRSSPPGGGVAPRSQRGELWTPVLASAVLVGLIEFAYALRADSGFSAAAAVWAAIVAGTAVALVVLLRRLPAPSFSPEVLRRGGLPVLLSVVALIPFCNLWYYTNVLFRYSYGYSSLTAALLAAPAQAASVYGAFAVKRFIETKGITVAGTTMLVAAAVALGAASVQSAGTPVLVPVVLLCLYGGSIAAAEVALYTAVMNRARPGEEAAVSSLRSAAFNVGGAFGVLFMSTVVSFGVYRALAGSTDGQLTRPELMEVLTAIHDGDPTPDVTARFHVSEGVVDQLAAMQGDAIIAGFRTQALGGAAVTLATAAIFAAARRRYPEAVNGTEPIA